MQPNEAAGFLARVETVERDSQAYHVEMRFGIADDGRRIRGMHDARVHAGRFQRVDRFVEAAQLDAEIEGLFAVRGREMGEGSRQVERPVERYLLHEGKHLVMAHADAVHAGVDGQMERRAHTVAVGRFAIGDREFRMVDRRRDAIAQQQRNRLHRRFGKKQNGRVDFRDTQLDSLIHGGDAKPARTSSQACLCAAYGSVAIGVGLHDGHQLRRGIEQALDVLRVLLNRAQVNFHPGPAAVAVVDIVEHLLVVGDNLALGRFHALRHREADILFCEARKAVQSFIHVRALSLNA